MIRTTRTTSRTWALVALGALLLAIAIGISGGRATAAAAGGSVLLCRDIGLVGCTTFTAKVADLGTTGLGNDQASSLSVSGTTLAVYFDTNYGGACDEYAAGTTIQNLGNTIVVNDAISSIQVGSGCPRASDNTPLHKAILCRDVNFQGCTAFTESNVADLGTTAVGNDAVSSLRVRAGYAVSLIQDQGFSGPCEFFSAGTSTFSTWTLVGSYIGNDQATSAS